MPDEAPPKTSAEIIPNTPDQTGTPEPADKPAPDATGEKDVAPDAPAPAETPAEKQARVLRDLKVYGQKVDFDLSDEERLKEVVQKGLAYDRQQESLDQKAERRAQEMLQEMVQAQEAEQNRIKEEQRLAELREADPLAADFEMFKSTQAKTAKELQDQLQLTTTQLQQLRWEQTQAQVRPQFPDFTEREWNRAYAEVVATNGQTSLADAARMVKEENDAFAKRIIDSHLAKLKSNAQSTPPAPGPGGTTPTAIGGEVKAPNFSNKAEVKNRVLDYLSRLHGEQ